jgi:MFS family permease
MKELAYPGFRWFVLITMLIVTSTSSLALISPAPLIGEMIKTMPNLSPGQITGITMGIFNLFVAIAALAGGFLLDKLGVIRVYIGGLLLIIIGELLVPVIGASFWGMILIRLLQGFGTGPIMASAAAIATTWFPAKERGIVAGIQGSAVSLGIAIGFILVPNFLKTAGSWQSALLWLAPVSCIGLLMTIIVAYGPKPPAVDVVETERINKGELKSALMKPVTWITIACVFMLSWVYQAFNDLTPGYLALDAPVGLGKGAEGSQLLVGAQISFMVGSILSGFINDKILKGNVRPLITTGFLLGAIFSIAIQFPAINSNSALLVICLTMASFFFSFVNPQAMAYIAKNYPKRITGTLGGLAMGVGIFGGTLGVAAGSTALHTTGLYQLSINIMCVISIIGFFLALGLKSRTVSTEIDKRSIEA